MRLTSILGKKQIFGGMVSRGPRSPLRPRILNVNVEFNVLGVKSLIGSNVRVMFDKQLNIIVVLLSENDTIHVDILAVDIVV